MNHTRGRVWHGMADTTDELTDAINGARARRDALGGIAQAELQGAINLALYLDGWTSNQPAHITLRGAIAEALDLLGRLGR